MVVWGRFGKTVISLLFIKGFKRAIYQMKGYIFFFCAMQTCRRSDLFVRKYKLKSFFFIFIFYFLNQDF